MHLTRTSGEHGTLTQSGRHESMCVADYLSLSPPLSLAWMRSGGCLVCLVVRMDGWYASRVGLTVARERTSAPLTLS